MYCDDTTPYSLTMYCDDTIPSHHEMCIMNMMKYSIAMQAYMYVHAHYLLVNTDVSMAD